MSGGNIPYKFTPDAEAERQCKRNTEPDRSNYTLVHFDKEAYRSNYDDIDWSKKG